MRTRALETLKISKIMAISDQELDEVNEDIRKMNAIDWEMNAN